MFTSNPYHLSSSHNSQNTMQQEKPSFFLDDSNKENQPYFFQKLFNKSEDISKLTIETTDLPQPDKREQIRNKVYAFDSSSVPNLNSSTFAKNTKPLQQLNDGIKGNKLKGGMKMDFKNPSIELKENIHCLEKLLSYQQNFCIFKIHSLQGLTRVF